MCEFPCQDGCVTDEQSDETQIDSDPFDFDAHRAQTVEQYRPKRGNYEDLAKTVQGLLNAAISAAGLKVQAIDERAKTEESLGNKAARPADAEGLSPKYANPLDEIQDLAGCRVITFFLDDVQEVRHIIDAEFDVLEMANRSSHLRGAGRPGYESYHFVVRLTDARLALAEYARFRGMVAEIQVRTILQHAWAEIEHDIQYKSVDALPAGIGRRFQALAGLIEIGDREFQAIFDAHEEVRAQAAVSLQAGRLSEIELTAESLKAYLDRKLGPDGRMRDWTYDWTASYLRQGGFENLQQLDDCIGTTNDDKASRAVWGSRQGQLTRLELVLLAGMGPERMKAIHPYSNSDPDDDWYGRKVDREAKTLEDAGFPIGNYNPGQAKPGT